MKPCQLITWLALSILVATACNLSKKDNKPYHPISDELLKKAINVQIGSYFVYADSVTGATDSFYCNAYRHMTISDFINSGSRIQEDYEFESYSLQSATNVMSFSCERSALSHYFILNKDAGASWCIYLPFVLGQSLTPETLDHTSTMYAYYDSMTVNGHIYYQVYHYTNKTYKPFVMSDTVYSASFYSVPSGMVKYTITGKNGYHAWELLRSNIVR